MDFKKIHGIDMVSWYIIRMMADGTDMDSWFRQGLMALTKTHGMDIDLWY